MKIFVFAIFATALFVIVGYFGFSYYDDNQNDTDVAVSTSQTSNASNKQRANNQISNQELQVLGAESQPAASSAEYALPLPSEFYLYEEYSDSEGALFIDVMQGSGAEAKTGDSVAMVYQGWLTDGQLFDQSRPNEEGLIDPIVFQLGAGQVIPGWDQGIIGMKQGSQRRLIIPAIAGYGAAGQGPIPPDSMLIFDVELVAIQQAEETQP